MGEASTSPMTTASKSASYVALVFGIVSCICDLCQFFPQTRWFEFLGLARTSVGYCHVDNGCRVAISALHGSNGIARAQNGTVYVGNSKLGQIRVFEEQSDQSFVLADIIALGKSSMIFDGLSVTYRHSSRVQIVSWTIFPSTQVGPYGPQEFPRHYRGSPRIMTRRKWHLRLLSGSRKTLVIKHSLVKN